MNRVLMFLFTISFASTLFAQNILVLKSGEKLNGKVERFRNDTLTFNFKGNKMQFKSSEIVSIYFDEKEISKAPSTVPEPFAEQKVEGKIAGVVTYYFNDNYGDKPDVGSKVLIIDALKVPDFKYSTVDSFLYANTYKNLYDSYAADRESKIPDNIIQIVKEYGVDTQAGFDALDNRTQKELNKIKFNNIIYCTKLVVDGNGTVSANVPPGKYYIVVASNNRTGRSMTEILGKIYFEKVEVKSGETSNFNAKFDLY